MTDSGIAYLSGELLEWIASSQDDFDWMIAVCNGLDAILRSLSKICDVTDPHDAIGHRIVGPVNDMRDMLDIVWLAANHDEPIADIIPELKFDFQTTPTSDVKEDS